MADDTQGFDDSGAGEFELGIEAQGLAKVVEGLLGVAGMQEGPALVGVGEGVVGLAG